MKATVPVIRASQKKKKKPFHCGEFFGKVKKLLGEPDQSTNLGAEGYYIWEYAMPNREREEEVHAASKKIINLMKAYSNLEFPESICEIAQWASMPKCYSLHIRIIIST
jgi:hypothetical protein